MGDGSLNGRVQLQGILPVFQTPYNDDESIDAPTLEKEINWLCDCGADGVVLAMVSEVLRLSARERRELAELACRFAKARGKTSVISVGAESAIVAESFARHAQEVGATAVMAIPPVAVALLESELLQYYRRIIRSVSIPTIVQDASGYVGRPMSIALQKSLMEEFGADRVMFKPEAVPIGPRLSELRDATQGKARIYEGTGGIALVDSFQRGIVGTMPGADLVRGIVALWKALAGSDWLAVNRLSGPICALVSMQNSLDAFLAVEKHLLLRQGVFRNTIVRGPVGYVLDHETAREVYRLFDLVMHNI
jgi:4-hydroxy-tetrahydrodipicolinate synthase